MHPTNLFSDCIMFCLELYSWDRLRVYLLHFEKEPPSALIWISSNESLLSHLICKSINSMKVRNLHFFTMKIYQSVSEYFSLQIQNQVFCSGGKNLTFLADRWTLLGMNWDLLPQGTIWQISLASLHFLTNIGLHLYTILTFRLGQWMSIKRFHFSSEDQIYSLHIYISIHITNKQINK